MFSFVNSGFMLFEGVVEDVMDPIELGRVRVRVFGVHTESKAEIPTDHLPWASVLMPVTSASKSGIGQTPGLVPGSHVVGYFRDGSSFQDPIVIGSFLSIPSKKSSPSVGFNDPTGEYPRYTDDSDRSSKSRGEKYRYNKVTETESGHIIELDDSKGDERVKVTHKSGTFIEIQPDGSILVDCKKNMTFKSEGNVLWDVTGSFTTVAKDVTITSTTKSTLNTGGSNVEITPSKVSTTTSTAEITAANISLEGTIGLKGAISMTP